MDEKKLCNREFQLKGIGRNMRYKLLQKRSTGVFPELNRCIFQISLTYIKLVKNYVTPLRNYPPPQQYNPPTKIKISNSPSKDFSEIFTPPPPFTQAGGRGIACPVVDLEQVNTGWTIVGYSFNFFPRFFPNY